MAGVKITQDVEAFNFYIHEFRFFLFANRRMLLFINKKNFS